MRPASDFSLRLRIYWEDTDGGGIVFYANYLKFFERARTEWLRALGFSQAALQRETGGVFVVHSTSVRYLRPARLDDELDVTVSVSERGRSGMAFHQQAWRGDELLAEGEIRIAWVQAVPTTGTTGDDGHAPLQALRPARIPASILQALERQHPAGRGSEAFLSHDHA